MTYNTFTSTPGVTYTSKVYSALYQPKCRMNIYTFTSTLGVTYTSKKCYFCQRALRDLLQNWKKNCYVATRLSRLSLRVLQNSKPSIQTPEALKSLKCFHISRPISHCVVGLILIISNIEYISKTIWLHMNHAYLISNSIGMGNWNGYWNRSLIWGWVVT